MGILSEREPEATQILYFNNQDESEATDIIIMVIANLEFLIVIMMIDKLDSTTDVFNCWSRCHKACVMEIPQET